MAAFSDCEIDAATLTCLHCKKPIRRATIRRQCCALAVTDILHAKQLTWATRASNYRKAISRWLRAGRPTRSPEKIEQLITEHCTPCDRFRDGACSECGCKINRSSWAVVNKLAMATEACPLEKFAADAIDQRDDDKPRKHLRVGFVIPCLWTGGVESWLWSLVSEWHKGDSVRCSGVALTSGAFATCMVEPLARLCPIVGPVKADGVAFATSANDAIGAVADNSDVVIVWAVTPEQAAVAKASGAVTVAVSHAIKEWWSPGSAHIDHWASVSEPALAAIPGGRQATIIPNGVDVERCQSSLTVSEARQRLGIPASARVYGYVGRFSAEKNIKLISQAIEHLPEHWHAVMCGGGKEQPIHHERLHVVPATREIGDIWRACDVGVIASQYESWCLAADEIHAARVPLVSTQVGAIVDAVEWITPEDSPEQVAQAIACAALRPAPGLRPERTAAAMARQWADYLGGLVAQASDGNRVA